MKQVQIYKFVEVYCVLVCKIEWAKGEVLGQKYIHLLPCI